MLTPKTIEIVKSTAPILAQTGPSLTEYFYERLFAHYPELQNIFNMSNQTNNAQREALFNAVYGYAANIDNIEALLPVVEKIANKHASFNITPEMYDIVGETLLATIDELLSPGQEVLDAWAEAYGFLASVFISREEDIYQEKENAEGGWRGKRAFTVIKKEKQSDLITSFTFAPVDGKPVTAFKPGQYIGITIATPDLEFQEIRQYSLAAAHSPEHYRIAVKRENDGKVSNYLHDNVNVGDTVELTPPHGDFFFNSPATTPVTLISAGVGLTPTLSMLETLSGNHKAEINWLHAAEHSGLHAFAEQTKQLTKQHGEGEHNIWYNTPLLDDLPGEDFDYLGFMDLSRVSHITKDPEQHYYMCGPVGFMQSIASQLTKVGVKAENIHYECFGPHKVLS
ncbi:NO-inducible flavohemoprotein [Veronia nyctiphanis]|uniref:Flavohemoprotein n=1 Tax=Veronia nyctiphanis TaxID=1278244 RepID=A0A4Q0YRU5_9GAMM|nr:NO-inducible flavohemoprotein [Veronia nyctiphanis]RXJ73373.1 NO-inducible flavohemoprotein [Veronia nyctiphanis]